MNMETVPGFLSINPETLQLTLYFTTVIAKIKEMPHCVTMDNEKSYISLPFAQCEECYAIEIQNHVIYM